MAAAEQKQRGGGGIFASRLRMPAAASRLPRVFSRSSNPPPTNTSDVVKTVGETSSSSGANSKSSLSKKGLPVSHQKVSPCHVEGQASHENGTSTGSRTPSPNQNTSSVGRPTGLQTPQRSLKQPSASIGVQQSPMKRTSSLRAPQSTTGKLPGSTPTRNTSHSLRRPAGYRPKPAVDGLQTNKEENGKTLNPPKTHSPPAVTVGASSRATPGTVSRQKPSQHSGLRRPISYPASHRNVNTLHTQFKDESQQSGLVKSSESGLSVRKPSLRSPRKSSPGFTPSPTTTASSSRSISPRTPQASSPQHTVSPNHKKPTSPGNQLKNSHLEERQAGDVDNETVSKQTEPGEKQRQPNSDAHINSEKCTSGDEVDGSSMSRPMVIPTKPVTTLLQRTSNLSRHAPQLPEDENPLSCERPPSHTLRRNLSLELENATDPSLWKPTEQDASRNAETLTQDHKMSSESPPESHLCSSFSDVSASMPGRSALSASWNGAWPESPTGKSTRNSAIRSTSRKSVNSPYSHSGGVHRLHAMPGDSILFTQITPTPSPPTSPMKPLGHEKGSDICFTPPGHNPVMLSSSLPAEPTITSPPVRNSSTAKPSRLHQPSYFRHAVSMANRRSSTQSTSKQGSGGSPSAVTKATTGSVVVLDVETYRQMQSEIKTLKALLLQLKRFLHDDDQGIALAGSPVSSPTKVVMASLGDDSSSATIQSLQHELEERDHRISAMQHQLQIWQRRAAATTP